LRFQNVTLSEARSLDRVPALRGVLHFDFGRFRLEPLSAYTLADGGVRPSAAPRPEGGGLTAAFMNCERMVRSLTAQAREIKLTKLALAIVEQLQSPDVVGVAEVEDLGLLEEIGARAGGYQAVLLRGCDFGNINVGLLYKPDRVRVLGSRQLQAEAPQLGNGRCTLPDGRQFTRMLFDRPPLVVDLEISGKPITVIVNHWRSRIGTDTTNEVERVASAEYVVDQIMRMEKENLIVMGDFNDTQQDIAMLTLRDRAGLTLLTDYLAEDTRYSLLFEGLSQAMDHILLSPALTGNLAAFGYAHYNADFPITPNENAPTPVRAADHDAVYVQFGDQAPAPRTR
jgi:predicted extracellular nuclease